MAQRTIRTGVELDRNTDATFEKWATAEGHSKRRHAAILVRHLTELWEKRPEDLLKLGLVHPRAIPTRA